MVYATNKQFIEKSGLGLRQLDETVGTGTGSKSSFDLDKDFVIGGTLTLSTAVSGSNSFGALTETTHYTVDLDSGRILLTTAGVTSLGTATLYATYWYNDFFSNEMIGDLLRDEETEIDIYTGRTFGTANDTIEYFDGRKNHVSNYAQTNTPYGSDWDSPDELVLKYYPVNKVDQVFFLNNNIAIDTVFNYDNSAGTYTDLTTYANDSTTIQTSIFAATPGTSDAFYVGSNNVFLGLDVNLGTNAVGNSGVDWQYYNGTAWTDITVTENTSGVSNFRASGKLTWDYLYGWQKSEVNSINNYWVRAVIGTSIYSTTPKLGSTSLKDSVSTVVEPRMLNFEDFGKLSLTGVRIPDGTKNVRVDYNYGDTTVPSYITDLCLINATIKAFVTQSGGSYDNATSYSLGSKAITIGEQYVNIREVLNQLEKRRKDILTLIGSRVNVTSI